MVTLGGMAIGLFMATLNASTSVALKYRYDRGGLGLPRIDCHGERHTNAPHASTVDPEVRLDAQAKGQEATLGDLGHMRMEKRPSLGVDTRVTEATGTAEWEAAVAMAEAIPGPQRAVLGADRHDATRHCVP